jgi:hypothetical protein
MFANSEVVLANIPEIFVSILEAAYCDHSGTDKN